MNQALRLVVTFILLTSMNVVAATAHPYRIQPKKGAPVPFWFAIQAEPGEIGRPVDKVLIGFRSARFLESNAVAFVERDANKVIELSTGKQRGGDDLEPYLGAFAAIEDLKPLIFTDRSHQGQSILAVGSNLRTDTRPPQLWDWISGRTVDIFPQDVFAAYSLQGSEFRLTPVESIFQDPDPVRMRSGSLESISQDRGLDFSLLGFGLIVAGILGVYSTTHQINDAEDLADELGSSVKTRDIRTQRLAWGALVLAGFGAFK